MGSQGEPQENVGTKLVWPKPEDGWDLHEQSRRGDAVSEQCAGEIQSLSEEARRKQDKGGDVMMWITSSEEV